MTFLTHLYTIAIGRLYLEKHRVNSMYLERSAFTSSTFICVQTAAMLNRNHSFHCQARRTCCKQRLSPILLTSHRIHKFSRLQPDGNHTFSIDCLDFVLDNLQFNAKAFSKENRSGVQKISAPINVRRNAARKA